MTLGGGNVSPKGTAATGWATFKGVSEGSAIYRINVYDDSSGDHHLSLIAPIVFPNGFRIRLGRLASGPPELEVNLAVQAAVRLL